jgi:putative colanic acid biosynthesis UDP-glucose lipid carrier transferase
MPGKTSPVVTLILTALKFADALSGVVVLGACQIAYQQRFYDSLEFQTLGILIMLLSPLCLDLAGVYRSWLASRRRVETKALILGCVLSYVCLLTIGYVLKISADFSRVIVTAWMVAWPVTLLLIRAALRAFLRRMRRNGQLARTAVIVGAGDLGLAVSGYLRANAWLGIGVQGFFDDRKEGAIDGHGPILGRTETVADHVRGTNVDFVYLALPMRAEEKIKRIVAELADSTATVYLVPDIFQFEMMLSGAVNYLGDIPAIALWESPFLGLNAALKRALDIVLGSLILVLVSPLMLLVALAVKLTSPGPVLFVQKRYGLDGKAIDVLKFRTMTVCENGHDFTQCVQCDPRVTPVGAFLRRYSLDEFPQFLNVLQGTMSIVGPRPHAVAMNEEYRKLVSGYMLRHKVKPGITGLAQVNGFRGPTDTIDKMAGRVRMDLEYIRTWTPLLDLKIILRTILGGFTGTNAF